MSTDLSTSGERRAQYDPVTMPELYTGVRTKRIFAFFIDLIAVTILTFAAGVLVFFLGIFTLGLAWIAYGILGQAVWLIYAAFTLGSPAAATPGMRAMGLEMRLWHGARPYPLLAAVHLLLFWFSMAFTPLILLVSLFSDRKRLLHDIVLGTVVVNSPVPYTATAAQI